MLDRDVSKKVRLRLELAQLDQDLGKLERAWARYQRLHPRPAFAPTPEQLPHLDEHGHPTTVQLALFEG